MEGAAAAGIRRAGWREITARGDRMTLPALTTSISLMAIYGQSRKLLESWWLWITADLVYIPLYFHKDLKLTSALYVIFLTLCVFGLLAWHRDHRSRTFEPAPVAA